MIMKKDSYRMIYAQNDGERNRLLKNESFDTGIYYKDVISDIPKDEDSFLHLKTLQMMERLQELGESSGTGLEIELRKRL